MSDTSTDCWVDLSEEAISDVAELVERFGLHELAAEDALHAHQRPKLEQYDDTLVLVAKPAFYDDEAEAIRIGELFVAIREGFIVTVRHGDAHRIGGRATIRHQESPLEQRRPVDVLYELLDEIVDGYQPIIRALQIDIEEIEQEVFSVERTNSAPRIYALKRHVLEMLRNVEPLIGPLERLASPTGDLALVTRDRSDADDLDEYFRDVADHVRRLVTQLHTVNDVLSDALQANLAQVSVSQNDDMRTMSAWAAIFLVPTLLAGVWGMNFDSMPELDYRYGYPLAIGIMILASFALWWQFRRSGWLGTPPRRR